MRVSDSLFVLDLDRLVVDRPVVSTQHSELVANELGRIADASPLGRYADFDGCRYEYRVGVTVAALSGSHELFSAGVVHGVISVSLSGVTAAMWSKALVAAISSVCDHQREASVPPARPAWQTRLMRSRLLRPSALGLGSVFRFKLPFNQELDLAREGPLVQLCENLELAVGFGVDCDS